MPVSTASQSYDVAIIGAGPTGLFSVFELGLLGLKAVVLDVLDKPGGQCAELYPEKPIYDIPSWPVISGQELTDKLLEQIAPFGADLKLGRQVKSFERRADGRFQLTTDRNDTIDAAAVFIAAGAGSFTPRKPKLEGLDSFEGKSVFYAVRDRASFAGKDIVVAGGGDSALDWANDLSEIAQTITLVHRSDRFRAAPASVEKFRALVAEGKARFVEGDLASLTGTGGKLQAIALKTKAGIETLAADRLLAFYGLNIELGPIAEWGLDLADGKQIKVDTEKFQTSTPGVFAVGDINWYPGKLKLILSGFHEAALASQEAFRVARPDEKLRFQYTTSSSELQQRLNVNATKKVA
ncbi:MAG: NAD(P)/FAD-dependent oxidoreductase [Proteobacteria bacterium]|nr:NAD(P)/FAD-dependent oxidoreductase [Pseudomonadota bacterium]